MARALTANTLSTNRMTGATFGRHESFHPRFGWLKKGFDKAVEDPSVFNSEDASVVLGVGKNMVRAIRYWCTAFKILEEGGDSKKRILQPTRLGTNLFAKNGWDPYLETDGALWYLHWNLLKSPCTATTWEFVFGDVRNSEFTPEDIIFALQSCLQTDKVQPVAESSIRGDVLCLLRMYSTSHSLETVRLNEETIVSPFVELGLIEKIPDSKAHVFRVGEKPSLPSAVIAAACLEYAADSRPGLHHINLSNLLHDRLSPGQCFKLTESSLYALLEDASEACEFLQISDTAGIAQLQFKNSPRELSNELLESYFAAQRGRMK